MIDFKATCDICHGPFEDPAKAVRLEAGPSKDGSTLWRVVGHGSGMATIIVHEDCLMWTGRRDDKAAFEWSRWEYRELDRLDTMLHKRPENPPNEG